MGFLCTDLRCVSVGIVDTGVVTLVQPLQDTHKTSREISNCKSKEKLQVRLIKDCQIKGL